MMPGKPLIACVIVLSGSACGPSATEADFESANPAATMYAIEDAGQSADPTATDELVELLDSDDPAIRLMAIEALVRITGETYDYHHEDPPYRRRVAIKRWVLAVEAGLVPSGSGVASETDNG